MRREELTMKVFIAGASGVVGRQLVPLLTHSGHEVVATTRSPEKVEAIHAAGAEPVILDLLDPDAVMAAVERAQPEVVVHEATSLTSLGTNMRAFDRAFAETNRLRTEGPDNLLAAARAAGSRRFVAQSFAGWPYAREGGPVKAEDDPLDSHPPAGFRRPFAAVRHLEAAVGGTDAIEGLVLRYGSFYGPGTAMGEGGVYVKAVRDRRFPIVGSGAGIWSFVHIDDVAAATLAAVEHGAPGIYNVVDDHPAPVAEWLPYLAEVLGAKRPWRVPAWLGRLAAGEHGVVMMTEIRGASNAKAKRELHWQPRYPSWREGFARTLR